MLRRAGDAAAEGSSGARPMMEDDSIAGGVSNGDGSERNGSGGSGASAEDGCVCRATGHARAATCAELQGGWLLGGDEDGRILVHSVGSGALLQVLAKARRIVALLGAGTGRMLNARTRWNGCVWEATQWLVLPGSRFAAPLPLRRPWSRQRRLAATSVAASVAARGSLSAGADFRLRERRGSGCPRSNG